jgi:sulfur relay (sulfurtransferase) complex TusBCD TusD component (DsrE family)
MKRRTEDEALGIGERRTLKQQERAQKEKAAHRAALDVLDGTVESCTDAAKARGVSREMVQQAVRAEMARRAGGGA